MKTILSIALIAVATLGIIATTGCSTTNRQQIVESTSGDGVLANASVPVTASSSIGLKLFVGRFNNTAAVNPTATTNLYAASAAVVVAGKGKQSLAGGAGTNSTAGINNAGGDGAVIILGSTTAGITAGTNASVTAAGTK